MTSSNGNIFRVTCPLCGEFTGPGEFPAQRQVTRSFDVFFDRRPNKRLSKQPWGWWFKTPSWSLWSQCIVSSLMVRHLSTRGRDKIDNLETLSRYTPFFGMKIVAFCHISLWCDPYGPINSKVALGLVVAWSVPYVFIYMCIYEPRIPTFPGACIRHSTLISYTVDRKKCIQSSRTVLVRYRSMVMDNVYGRCTNVSGTSASIYIECRGAKAGY